ncbi:TIGR03084 family metal-binding protein [Streptomyces sp. XM4193]|uniref:TIGR03084 family metal-binding protein n=1 Tax=Streptomyces sp. XM4193 TaxID=2929782 RepID=UPI001FFBE4CD|nr:TIGR03084 family metal-binding protein [Streptomyces sp. XM4193]MCK1794789.1 TIGR03084 family metal-binding protein [Streptomyces sp. XM4193]
MTGVPAELRAEGEELDRLVRELPPEGWSTPTPAPGWTVAHQIGHLAWTDEVALLSATRPDAFRAELERAMAELEGYVDRAAAEAAERADLVDHWRATRTALAQALAEVPSGTKLPWFGPPMSAMSMATARLMETWAHGQDVADALGVVRAPTARLRNVAHLGVRTRDFSHMVNGRTAPDEPFRVELLGPDGQLWVWGPQEADQRVTGPALDFCLLVTRRRHRDDLAVVAHGEQADAWLDFAQAFAGPPGEGRKPSAS